MEVNIAYSSSDAYSKCTGISIMSLFQNNTEIDKLNVYIFSTDISDDNKDNLMKIAQIYNRDIIIIDVQYDIQLIAKRFRLDTLQGRYNTYVRLFCSEWLAELERVLFIDSDTLITGPINELYFTEMGDMLITAVPDLGMYGRHSVYEDYAIVKMCPKYINAGVMLINLEQWRKECINEYIAGRILDYKNEWQNQEQSIINYALHHRCLYAHLKYNYYTIFHYERLRDLNAHYDINRLFTKEECDEARKNPVIVHFVGSHYDRPWYQKSVSPFKEVYLEYYDKSPWREEPLESFPKNYQIGYRLYDYILYIMRKQKCHKLYYYFRIVLGQRLKGYLVSIMGKRS